MGIRSVGGSLSRNEQHHMPTCSSAHGVLLSVQTTNSRLDACTRTLRHVTHVFSRQSIVFMLTINNVNQLLVHGSPQVDLAPLPDILLRFRRVVTPEARRL